MQWFSALIPAYPEIQKKAQAELDRVVGRDRLPTIEDEVNLPYCHAIVKEVCCFGFTSEASFDSRPLLQTGLDVN